MPVTVTVENGSVVTGANSYLSVADWKLYAAQRGWDYSAYSNDLIGSALIRATSWLDATYRARWPGVRASGREQSLAWPRSSAYDIDEEVIADDEIPLEVVDALAEAAWRELASPGSLSPDLDRGGDIRRIKAGSVELEYSGTASALTTYTVIDRILLGLLSTPSSSGFTGTTVRA